MVQELALTSTLQLGTSGVRLQGTLPLLDLKRVHLGGVPHVCAFLLQAQ